MDNFYYSYVPLECASSDPHVFWLFCGCLIVNIKTKETNDSLKKVYLMDKELHFLIFPQRTWFVSEGGGDHTRLMSRPMSKAHLTMWPVAMLNADVLCPFRLCPEYGPLHPQVLHEVNKSCTEPSSQLPNLLHGPWGSSQSNVQTQPSAPSKMYTILAR